MRSDTRPAAVAGSFYPGEAGALAREVAGHLAAARTGEGSAAARPVEGLAAASPEAAPAIPKLLLVPHAGFVYSGAVAAMAYARLEPARQRIRRVVLLGPTHRVAVRGLAAPTVSAFETPLGRIAIDRDALDRLADLPQVVASDRVHAQEHSLEVQLPFLQTVLAPGFTLVPLAVGEASADEVAQVLERLWGDDETLIVISSDLSHFQPYAAAQALDRATVDRILQLDDRLDHGQACGATPLRGALRVARRHGLQPVLLDLRNSGDTAGDRARVVGYAAVAFLPTGAAARPAADQAVLGAALLSRARNVIAGSLGLAITPEPWHPALAEPGASFVTLLQGDELRGCIGTLVAEHPLEDDVRHRALGAAFHDTRFEPVTADEWPGLSVEVSVLDAPQPLPVASEADACQRLRPGIDGVLLEWHGHRATFLPQVWDQLPRPADFLAALKRKAGLAADFWAPDVRLSVYGVQKFSETEAEP